MYPNISDLHEVNAEINKGPYGDDPVDFDDWRPPVNPTDPRDCDSYATAKVCELVARGWPVECLRLAMCYIEPTKDAVELKDRGHLVLDVSHEGREYILDNRQHHVTNVTELHRIGYIPISLQRVGGQPEFDNWKWEAA